MIAPWLAAETPIVYKALSMLELLDLWKRHRNDHVGLMAADEVCRRLSENMPSN